MTDRETMIEEAAKAIYGTRDDAYDLDVWKQLDRAQQERYVCDARVALAVFEKAHTPTDDEREALADRLARRLIADPKQLMLAEGTGALHVALSESIRSVIEDVYADCGDSDPGVLSPNIARRLAGDLPTAILAAGFRRSEVPEPSVESCRMCASSDGPEHSKACHFDEHDGCDHEPQGEPSDAERLVAWAEYRKDFQPNVAHLHREAIAFHEGWRAALCAAESVIRCDYCGGALSSVKSRADIPTTPELQRIGFAADKVVCPECVGRARAAGGVQ